MEKNDKERKLIIADELYIAKTKAALNVEDTYGKYNDDKPLGIFLVKPIYKVCLLHKLKLVGYAEAVSNQPIIKRTYNSFDEYTIEPTFTDYTSSNRYSEPGDLLWYVEERYVANKVLTQSQIVEYLQKSDIEILNELEKIREQAKELCKKPITLGVQGNNVKKLKKNKKKKNNE